MLCWWAFIQHVFAKAALHLEEEAFRKRGPPTSEVSCEAFMVLWNLHNTVFEKVLYKNFLF